MAHETLSDWRTRDEKPIAVLRQEPADLAKLRFKRAYDDLDYVQYVRIRGASGRVYSLVKHERAPAPGTEVFTLASSRAPRRDLAEVLRSLGLGPADVTWMAKVSSSFLGRPRPAIKKPPAPDRRKARDAKRSRQRATSSHQG